MNAAFLTAGAKGFDTAQRLDARLCRAFKMHGYEFVMRYVWRTTPHPFDLSLDEVSTILASGLELGVVQHFAGEGWIPTGPMGALYGAAAASACLSLGIPPEVHAFLDLEGIDPDVPADVVDQYARAWSYAMKAGGHEKRGLYVGDSCILGPRALYELPFDCYWRSYNLDDDRVPAARGFAMRQRSATEADVPPGCGMTTADFDVNIVSGDALGGFPSVVAPASEVLA
jgi:hypothetical protein